MTYFNNFVKNYKVTMVDQTLEKVSNISVHEIFSYLIQNGISIGLKILAAICIYLIGAWLIKKIKKIVRKILIKRNIDQSLSSFLLSFTTITLTLLLIIMTVDALGVNTSSFVALLAGSGLAVGMALSGTLQNFAGGIMILLFKPFKVGDYIEAQGYTGTVNSIEITTTHIATDDNKIVILPNGALSNGTINNYSVSGTRRCEWKISISYNDNLNIAKSEIHKILEAEKRIMSLPSAPFVALLSMGDNSITLVARAWVKSQDYLDVFYGINEQFFEKLPQSGIHFPFPQMDIHICKE